MLRSSITIRLDFLGWRDPVEQDKFHNSPEYFENIWAGEGIAGKPLHPRGLINLFERRKGDCITLDVLVDPGELSVDQLLQTLRAVGLNVKLLDSA